MNLRHNFVWLWVRDKVSYFSLRTTTCTNIKYFVTFPPGGWEPFVGRYDPSIEICVKVPYKVRGFISKKYWKSGQWKNLYTSGLTWKQCEKGVYINKGDGLNVRKCKITKINNYNKKTDCQRINRSTIRLKGSIHKIFSSFVRNRTKKVKPFYNDRSSKTPLLKSLLFNKNLLTIYSFIKDLQNSWKGVVNSQFSFT